MKAAILPILLFLSTTFCAQPVLHRDAMPERGNRFHYAVVDGEIDPGSAGENVRWDFSECTSYGDFELLYLDPEGTPLGDSILDADLVIQESQSFRIDYYTLDNSAFSLIGSSSPASIGLETKYDDPWMMFQFPFTYQSRFSDEFSGSTTLLADEEERFRSINGSSYVIADGWGTLEILGKQIPNVLRIATTVDRIDTVFSDDGGFDLRYINYRQYEYWDVVTGTPCAQWRRTEGYNVEIHPGSSPDTTVIGPSYRFAYEISSGGKPDFNRPNTDLFATPNPFENIVHLNFYLPEAEHLLIQVIDTEGPIVKHEWLPAHEGWNKHDIEVEGSPGIYRLIIEGPKTIMTSVLLKSQ